MNYVDFIILGFIAGVFVLFFKGKFKNKKRKCVSCLYEKQCKNNEK